MKPNFRQSIILIGLLFFCSCITNTNLVKVTDKNFDGEIDRQQNLVFTFNKDLYPDSLLQFWDSTEYIQFDPAVKGMFKWNSSSELMFSPSEGFQPGMEYTAKLSHLLLKRSPKFYTLGNENIFHFHTAPLRITHSHLSWTRGKNADNVMVQLDMDFNYEVKLNEAAAHLKLSSNGNAVNIMSANTGAGKTLSIQFMPLNDLDQQTLLQIEMDKGISVTHSKYISTTDTTFSDSIPSRFSLAVTDVTAQHDGSEGTITVNTSEPVLEDSLKSMISIDPSVPFDVSLNDAGFTITSDKLSPTQTYQLTISSNLEGAFGGKMKGDYSGAVTFGKLKPAISFINEKGMYLSSQGFKNLALNIVNIPKVHVSVIKVYENNLEYFMRKDKRYEYGYDEDNNDQNNDDDNNDYGSYEYYDTENLGDTVFQQDYVTDKLPKQNASSILHLDFTDKIKDYNGIYVITVSSKQHYWIQESKVLSISDIGLIVKQEKDNMYVFANSIKDATNLEGINISFISTNNQKLYTATTDGSGVAVFKNISKHSPGFTVGMITAKKNDEFSFVWMGSNYIETSRFDVGGRSPNSTGLNAMIYAERNLYRPGETIHVSTVIRDEQWNDPGEVPVKFKLVMPNGKEFATMRKILNEEGSCETSFAMPQAALTGTYTLQVLTGNDVLLNSYDISIEEFMPDRIKVGFNIDKQEYHPGDSVRATIQADNLFGTPAANMNYQCEMNMSKDIFSSKKFSDYNFSVVNNFTFNADRRSAKVNETGGATENFSLPKDILNTGLLKGNIMTTVFDETGRPVHRYQNFEVYTQPVFIGIKSTDEYINTRVPAHISLIALDKNENVQSTIVQIQLVKKDWHTVIQQDGNSFKYVSQQDEKIISQQKVSITGTSTNFFFTPQLSGDYEVRIFYEGSDSYVSAELYAWGYDDTQYTSFEVNNEGNVDIKTDKEKYGEGETINALFTTPFEGKMLVTVERDHLIKYYYLDTKNKAASLSLKTDDEYLPNIYISATLFRPMDGSDMPLTVAHGIKSVIVENAQNHLPVSITAVDKSRSKTKQTIIVKTQPGAYVTIAAVDEGILQVKNYSTPDPYSYFYQKIALLMNSYDIYPWLLPEIKTSRSSTGGDGNEESKMRVNPVFVNRVKLVSFWSGIMQADGSGIVRYNIDIPQFSGDLRIMAAAYKGKAFGDADKHMKVADPVVISTALPRFLSPKDEVEMPVSLSNTTGKDANAAVSIQLTGPLNIMSQNTQSIKLLANHEQRVIFNISAQQAIGAAKVLVVVKAMNEIFTDETEIGVRPPASLQKQTGSGSANESATAMIIDQSKFIPSSVTSALIIGKSPLVPFSKNLSSLVNYPYGCVEQTTSVAFPQLYYYDLVKSITGKTDNNMNPAYNVQQAINKLQSMQLPDGALSYWPGGGYESWWGSIYATNFLLEARKAGYEVNNGTVDRLLQYMQYKLNSKETITFYYNGNSTKLVTPEEVSYSLYVLALAGQAQQSSMNYYKAHPELLTLDSKYLLSAAYSLSGQSMQAKALLPPAFEGEKANTEFGGSFYSYVRDEALSLNVLLDIDPNNAQVGIMAKHVAEQLQNQYYLNTQENAFSLLALGKVARIANNTNATATLSVNGKIIGTTTGNNLTLDTKQYINTPIQLSVIGKGNYYFFRETNGLTSDGSYLQEDKYLKVRRTFLDKNGHEISSNNFHQNDLIVVKLTLESQYSSDIPNVVITDMLPAGFEIENTRLTEMPDMKWITDEAKADYNDIRDDRILMFTSASSETKVFYYMVRAVSPGKYQLGPVQADAMYNGAYHSYNGAGVITISDN
jgi:uncharacterized protein YfaS (alpha-2-macroglobulin family)